MKTDCVTRLHNMSLERQLEELRKLYKDFFFLFLDDEIKQKIHFMYSEKDDCIDN